ncbi:hypothetical protein NW768_006572 [Fusarium equiseti]|uniref:Uncharacterized protein n=1 Tax=Fusarium equiseti TaxID=61235 RepID=A0ABQ8RBU1_FUSEQ|nr:hypothetical protein NW768_006572 [Fusarium equiseti]
MEETKMVAIMMAIAMKSATKPKKQSREGGRDRMMKRWLRNIATDSADDEVEAPEDTNTGSGVTDELPEDGVSTTHHSDDERHEDEDVAVNDEAPGDTNTGHGITNEPSEDGDNSIFNEAPGHTGTENGTVDGLSEDGTSSAHHGHNEYATGHDTSRSHSSGWVISSCLGTIWWLLLFLTLSLMRSAFNSSAPLNSEDEDDPKDDKEDKDDAGYSLSIFLDWQLTRSAGQDAAQLIRAAYSH